MAKVEYKDMIKFVHEITEVHNLFKGLSLAPLKSFEGREIEPLMEYETKLASGFRRLYQVNGDSKIEKICIGELHYMKRAIYSSFSMTPTGDYDLPMFMVEFDQSPPWVSVTVDFFPVVDIAVYDDYRVKYLDPLEPLWNKYKEIPGITEGDRCLVGRRFAPWAWALTTLSPYVIDGKVRETEDRYRALEAAVEYARVWLKLCTIAEPIKETAYKEEVLVRRRQIRQYYEERDPGVEVSKKIFGEERAEMSMGLLF